MTLTEKQINQIPRARIIERIHTHEIEIDECRLVLRAIDACEKGNFALAEQIMIGGEK
jgi:hypothetical protein